MARLCKAERNTGWAVTEIPWSESEIFETQQLFFIFYGYVSTINVTKHVFK